MLYIDGSNAITKISNIVKFFAMFWKSSLFGTGMSTGCNSSHIAVTDLATLCPAVDAPRNEKERDLNDDPVAKYL